ncbi:hypothetical protein [Flavobacterium sp. UBA7663]|uniref:hypothetical protein n=1 Tax=Flavobacterium sp. UBA7663 TaxID=1946557 RepID=UPI0025BC165E|nr:hypothetical protein [Flavobacterium sp. UBA7663]
MEKFILLITSFILIACNGEKKKENKSVSIFISNSNYNCDLEKGIFKIPAINFVDTLHLNSDEKNKILNAFYKYHIDTLNGDKHVAPEKPIMPDFSDEIKISIAHQEKLRLKISSQLENSNLNKVQRDIFEFRNQLYDVLNKNSGFKKCMNIVKSNYKNFPPGL